MIPFNKPTFGENERRNLADSLSSGHASGNGPFTKLAETKLSQMHRDARVLLTTSCTHALEMTARLAGIGPGDEVIVPAYAFVSTASAFLWNGARPVFADIRADTLNVDPYSVEGLITARTKAICILHYGGVGAEPDLFVDLCESREILLIEDNAHGLGSMYRGRPLGTFGSMSTLSFHETKNVTCGEGGAIILNDPGLTERAEILREKGTDRSRFSQGRVDKYTWVDVGSSWVMSDLLAAVLVGQLDRIQEIASRRLALWDRYQRGLAEWSGSVGVELMRIPPHVAHTGHMFFLLFTTPEDRDSYVAHMRKHDIMTPFHYQPLDLSQVGRRISERQKPCPIAENVSKRIARLPLFPSLTDADHEKVIGASLTWKRSVLPA